MANKIYIQLEFSADGAEKSIDQLNQKIKNIGDTTEKSTKKATASVTGFTDSLFKALLGANVAQSGITQLARTLADFTKEAVKSAAQFEELEGSNRSLAATANISTQAMNLLKAQLRDVNLEGVEASKIINESLLEGITDPKQIAAIGKLAQSIERITGRDAVENAQAISLSVASGNTRRLRELGLIVDLNNAETARENQLKRFLTDRELIELRLTKVISDFNQKVKEGDLPTQTLLQGWRDFHDTFEEFKRKFGDALVGPLTEALKLADQLLQTINTIQTAQRGLTLIPGAVFGSKTQPPTSGILSFLGDKLINWAGDTLDKLLPPPPPIKEKPPYGPETPPPEPPPTKELLEQRKLAKEAAEAEIQAEQQLQNERKSTLVAIEAVNSAQTASIAKQAKSFENSTEASKETLYLWVAIEAQRRRGIEQLIKEGEQIKRNRALTVDEFGNRRYKPLSPGFIRDVDLQTLEKIRQLNIRLDAELNENFAEIAEARVKIISNLIDQLWIEPARQALQIWDELRQDTEKLADLRYQQSVQGIEQRTQAELESLQAVEVATLKQAVILEERKRDITIRGLRERNTLQQEQIDVETEREVQKEFGRLRLAGVTDERIYQQRRESLEKLGQLQKDIAQQVTDAAIREAAIRANAEVQQAILAQSRQTFDKIKDFTSGIFDAFTQKSTSVFKAIADVFKNTFINALKEIVTSQFAIALYKLLGYGTAYYQGPGQPVSFTRQAPGTGYTGLGFGRSILGAAFGYGGTGVALPAPVGVSDTTFKAITEGGGTGEANREYDDRYYAATGQLPPGGLAPVPYPSLASLGIRSITAAPAYNPSQLARAREAFNVGKPVTVIRNGSTQVIPWAQATATEKLRSVLRSSGFRSLAASVGITAALGGLSRSGLGALVQTGLGGALAGYGFAKTLGLTGAEGLVAGLGLGVAAAGLKIGGTLGDIATVGGAALTGYTAGHLIGLTPAGGALLGAGAGLFAAGLRRGGAVGVAETTLGGAAAGAAIGSIVPGIGTAVGAAVGAVVGLGAGIARLFIKTLDEKVRAAVKNVYGIDIPDAKIRQQIVDIAKQRYGGNIDVAVRSQEVQEIVRLYALATGQQARLPRPLYPVAIAQQGGSLQTQPVYSNGQLVQNPYTGVTTSQWQTAGLYLQINPAQANALFEGRVVNVLEGNPASVSQATASGAASGNGRTALRSALFDPLTVNA